MENFKTVIVTGSSGVIGNILVSNFLQQNYRVIGISSSLESSFKQLEKYKKENEKKLFYCTNLDFLAEGWEEKLVNFLTENKLNPEYVVCGARSIKFLKAQYEKNGFVKRADFSGEFTLGVLAPYELIMRLSNMENSHFKSAVILSSMYGVVAPNKELYNDFVKESFIHYGVVKSAQIHLAKELSVRLAGQKIRVNTVSFGGIEGRASEEFKVKYSKLSPIGRMQNETDIFGPVEFLLSDKSSAVLGHNLNADGGWCIW